MMKTTNKSKLRENLSISTKAADKSKKPSLGSPQFKSHGTIQLGLYSAPLSMFQLHNCRHATQEVS